MKYEFMIETRTQLKSEGGWWKLVRFPSPSPSALCALRFVTFRCMCLTLRVNFHLCNHPLLSCISVKPGANVFPPSHRPQSLCASAPLRLARARTHHSRRWASRCVRRPGAACRPRGEFCRSVAAWRAGTCWSCPPRRHPATGTPPGRGCGTSLRTPALCPGWTWGCICSRR